MGKKRAGVLLLISILAAFSLVMAGCSSGGGAKGLKDDDVIKAVTTTVEAAPGVKLTSPVTILERGEKNPAGEYAYKVEYSVTLPDGSSKKETKGYKISSGGSNDMGVPVWNAAEVK